MLSNLCANLDIISLVHRFVLTNNFSLSLWDFHSGRGSTRDCLIAKPHFVLFTLLFWVGNNLEFGEDVHFFFQKIANFSLLKVNHFHTGCLKKHTYLVLEGILRLSF